ncbi:MAG TPA: PfkB family carbohydrate kinase, partial [Planctomycetota bacterium]|nr:PfkB family carbohydrate kinase [Planctomycetota bacterium]
LIVPNDYEAGNAINLALDSQAAIERAGEMLLGCQNVQNVIITRGKDGMSVFSRGASPVHLRTYAQEVFDVTGAGDTVTASTTLCLLAGAAAAEAAQVANLAAGVAVSKVGTVTVSANDILDAHARHTGLAASSKIKSLPELAAIVDGLRRDGVKIAWTNGCFDILHTGHLSYLRKARQAADVLILGVSGDKCVARLKGPGRPINKQDERAELLAELECIDYVTIFEEESPSHIIAALKPNVYIKGGDYTIDTINQVERRVVEGYGGDIMLIGLVEGISTTKIISRIQERGPK